MKEQILAMLRQAEGSLSGQAISNALGVSRAAVWKAIEKLRAEGYVIESATNRGYRLVRTTDNLCLEETLSHLPDSCGWKHSVQYFDCIDSTNDRAKTLAAAGAPHGTVLIADRQTGGRGRRGRSFVSPAGMGVYLSVILRPDCRPQDLMHLTCAVAVAMCNAVQKAAGFRPGIKWTNDLVSGGKKLCGILTELSVEAESDRVQYAVVGIGINCCQMPSDFPPEIRDMAGSLSMVSGQPVNRNRLAAAMVKSLEDMDSILLTQKDTIMQAYRDDCITIGREVSLLRADVTSYGKAIGVDDSGALLVSFQDGHVEAVNSGEVSVRGMYGYA